MHLDPKHLTLNGLLQGRLFRIPDYQRAYAWGKKQRDELFADIREAQRSGQDHFMATLVCLARDKKCIAADEYLAVDVVDGQQRLTTIIILLKAIEKSLNPDLINEGRIKRDLGELLVKGDEHSLVLLQTNHDSSSVFLNYIRKGKLHNGDIKTSADRNLVDAATECEAFVAEWKEKSDLVELVAILRNRFSAIYHELSDEASVYRVFEVLNSRGLDVKWIDKLKSQLMALIFAHADSGARHDALSEMQVIWQDIYRILGLRGALGNEALRFAGTLRSGTRPNRLLGPEDAAVVLTKVAGSELKTIIEVANWLKAVVMAVDRLDQNNRLRAVTRIINARVLAAAILLRDFPPEVERDLLARWERVTFRIFGLGGADTRHKIGDYVRLAYDVGASKAESTKIMQAIKTLGSSYSITKVLENIDWSDSYEGWSEELRYILFRYDEHLAREDGERLNEGQWNKIWADDPSKSIEHITPQSSGKNYIHHIGNLMMLPPGVNSSLQDQPPIDKAPIYESCGLKGTMKIGKQINASKVWDESAVLKRSAQIEEFIRTEWGD